MSLSIDPSKLKRLVAGCAFALALIGIALRFTNITLSEFVYYDEGYYLNYTRALARLLVAHYPQTTGEFLQAAYAFLRVCMASGKSLWFLIADVRVFFGGAEAWYVPRVLAAVLGSATLLLAYRFSRRYYDSPWEAWLTVAVLAVVPSHVFYSRIGMQEALSTFLVLSGFYFYVFPRSFGARSILAGALFALAFFANYRLIILPVLIAAAEGWLAWERGERLDFRKYLWCVLIFLCGVFLIGNIDDGKNTIVTFSWMFHQGQLAEQAFDPINFFSYPYYLFRLDNLLFGIFFFGNLAVFWKRPGRHLPFILSLIMMGIFSFAAEKGARYLCVMYPFLAMSVSAMFVFLIRRYPTQTVRLALVFIFLLMTAMMLNTSAAIARIRSDYHPAVEFIQAQGEDVKFLSTQPYVQNLYVRDPGLVREVPHSFDLLMRESAAGARYLVLCPQAYISWTENDERFRPELDGYLGFVVKNVRPVRVFDHFDRVMMERFVFEHNQNLRRSIEFLALNDQRFGELKIYQVDEIIQVTLNALARKRPQGTAPAND